MDEPEMPGWQAVLLAAVLGFATDYIWASMMSSVERGAAFEAANWGFLLHWCGVFTAHRVSKGDWTAVFVFGVAR